MVTGLFGPIPVQTLGHFSPIPVRVGPIAGVGHFSPISEGLFGPLNFI